MGVVLSTAKLEHLLTFGEYLNVNFLRRRRNNRPDTDRRSENLVSRPTKARAKIYYGGALIGRKGGALWPTSAKKGAKLLTPGGLAGVNFLANFPLIPDTECGIKF